MKFPKYFLAAATAFIIWGFFSFGLKPIHHYPSQDILFYRVFTCIILMVVINFTVRRDKIKETRTYLKALTKTERRNQWLLIAGSSVLLTGNWGMFIYVMNQISVKAASFAYLVCPILTTVFAYIILKEKLTKIQWFAVLISFISCTILSYNDLRDAMFSIVVAATYALYLVLQKRITMPDRFILLTLQIGIVALMLLPFYPVYSSTPPVETTFYLFILLIAVLFTIIPMFLNLFAMKGINSSTVGILIYLNPLIAFALAILYYKEDITFEQILSYSLILVSIVIFNIGSYLKMKAVDKPIS
ncbi:MAG: EamA family transporter [Flavobacterium psychrophilum]|nr:MAG: EamA family transporter [Flavobacterium psychrophilum]